MPTRISTLETESKIIDRWEIIEHSLPEHHPSLGVLFGCYGLTDADEGNHAVVVVVNGVPMADYSGDKDVMFVLHSELKARLLD